MQEIAESDATPSITRVSDARETGFSLATSKERHGFDKFLAGTVLPTLMKAKGWNSTWRTREHLPLVHRLRGRRGARQAPEEARRRDRQEARRHRRRHRPGRALRPEEVRHPVPARLPARPGRRGRRVGDGDAVVEARPAARRGRRRRRRGVRRDRHQGLDHVPPVALVPLGRVPLLHVRVRLRRRPDRRVRHREERDPAGLRRQRRLDLAPPRRRARARAVARAGHLGRGRRGHARPVRLRPTRDATSTRARSSIGTPAA